MLQFMGDNKRLLQFHEQKLSDLEAFKSDTQMFQKNTSASLKNLETQVGQLALNVPNQNKGTCNAPFQIHIRLADPNLIWDVMLLITLNLEL